MVKCNQYWDKKSNHYYHGMAHGVCVHQLIIVKTSKFSFRKTCALLIFLSHDQHTLLHCNTTVSCVALTTDHVTLRGTGNTMSSTST